MQTSCAADGQTNDQTAEIAAIKSSINSISASTGVDQRFIFAVIIQESKGCVRVKSTPNPSAPNGDNPGLMQSAGTTTCFGITPCPNAKINAMISEGTAGVGGTGLKQSLSSATASDVAQKTYQAARIYNSGSLGSGGNLATGAATPCYSSDIANRLVGVVFSETSCTLTG